MERIKTWVNNSLISQPDVNGILVYHSAYPSSPITDGYDFLVLIVTDEDSSQSEFTNHYIKDGTYIQERWVKPCTLEKWILSGQNRNIIHWIIKGEVLLDKDHILADIKEKLAKFPQPFRDQKMLLEFSHFLRSYMLSKQYLKDGQLMDAYGNVLEALLHWARIAIIEAGIHPELMVWEQIHKINPGIYKLYEELTLTTETLKQRVELVHLACEFSVMSKMEGCCALLIRILKSRPQPWSPSELHDHDLLRNLKLEIGLILKKLTMKSIVTEIVSQDANGTTKLLYTC